MSPIGKLRRQVQGTPGGHTYAVGAVVLIGMTVVLLLVYSQSLQRVTEFVSGSETVKAQFANTAQLKPRRRRPCGRRQPGQGQEDRARTDGARSAIVTMRLNKDPELHGDASAALRFKLLLGGSLYVDIEPARSERAELGVAARSRSGARPTRSSSTTSRPRSRLISDAMYSALDV